MRKHNAKKQPKPDGLKGYNGWTNYETWAVNLWLTNDQASQEATDERATLHWRESKSSGSLTREEVAALALADDLKNEHEERSETALADHERSSVFTDLLNAALSEVNWYEIAKCFVQSARDAERHA